MNDQPQLSAHQFSKVYEDLGYDLSKLGCIMAPIVADDDLAQAVADTIEPADLYVSDDPTYSWVGGNVIASAHITLLYGLLRSGLELKQHVDAVLDDGRAVPHEVKIDHIGFFDSPYSDQPYWCLVAFLAVDDELQAAHDRLTFLPHIDTFPGYHPHVTLAYITKDNDKRDAYVRELNERLSGLILTTADNLDYGRDR